MTAEQIQTTRASVLFVQLQPSPVEPQHDRVELSIAGQGTAHLSMEDAQALGRALYAAGGGA